MNFSVITQYLDIWLFFGLFILFIGISLSLWHRLNIPIIIFFGTLAGGFAIWGSEFYNITMKAGFDYLRYGGELSGTATASIIFIVGFFGVIVMAIINILLSYQGDAEFWK